MKQKTKIFHIMNSLISVFTALTGATLILFFYSFGFSAIKVNMLIAAAVISVFLFEVPSGAISDRWGQRPVLLLGGFLLMATNVLFALLRQYWIAVVAQILSGASTAFLSGSLDSWLFDDPGFDHAKIESVCINKHKLQSIVCILGGIISGVIADRNINLVFVVSLIATGVYLVLVYKYVPKNAEGKKTEKKSYVLSFYIGIKKTIRESIQYCVQSNRINRILLFNGIITFATATVFVNWSPLLNQYGGNNYSIMGIAWTLMQLSLLAGSAVAKYLKGKSANIYPLIVALLGCCIICIVIFEMFYVAFICLLLFEFVLGIINPLKESILNNEITMKARATILSFQSMITNIMYYLSLLLSGWLISTFSSFVAWIVSGGILLVSSIVYWNSLTKKEN